MPRYSDPKLARLYRILNRRVFGGRLPRNITIRWTQFVDDDEPLARVWFLWKLPKAHRQKLGDIGIDTVIQINSKLEWTTMVTAWCLLHEAMHVYLGHRRHDKRFKRAMLRALARMPDLL